jgi:hypothetical protein
MRRVHHGPVRAPQLMAERQHPAIFSAVEGKIYPSRQSGTQSPVEIGMCAEGFIALKARATSKIDRRPPHYRNPLRSTLEKSVVFAIEGPWTSRHGNKIHESPVAEIDVLEAEVIADRG